MRIKPLIFAGLGIALSGGAIYLAEGVLNPQQAAAANPSGQATATEVVLIAAAKTIKFGEPIRSEDLVAQTWPKDLAPAGAYDSATKLLGQDGTAPRRALRSIREGELILSDRVSEFGATVTIGSTLTSGTRAVAIRVSAETAVGGFVSPGDRVDIVLTSGAGANLRTGVILQNTQVLAVDQNTSTSGARRAKTVTLEVTSRGSQKLVLAQQAGNLSLVLRNDSIEVPEDELEQLTMQDIWEDAEEEVVAPVAAPAPQIPSRTIRVRRGTSSQDEVIDQ